MTSASAASTAVLLRLMSAGSFSVAGGVRFFGGADRPSIAVEQTGFGPARSARLNGPTERSGRSVRWRLSVECAQVVAQVGPVRRGRPVVAGDQGRTGGAVPGVPGPAQVRQASVVEPLHDLIDETVRAGVLPDLPCHERHLGRDGGQGGVPAALVRAGVEVVDVVRGGEIAGRVGGLVRQPLAQVVGVREPMRPGSRSWRRSPVRSRRDPAYRRPRTRCRDRCRRPASTATPGWSWRWRGPGRAR